MIQSLDRGRERGGLDVMGGAGGEMGGRGKRKEKGKGWLREDGGKGGVSRKRGEG